MYIYPALSWQTRATPAAHAVHDKHMIKYNYVYEISTYNYVHENI